MTLYRQIALSILLLLILGFLGTMIISTNNLRTFLVTQLESHAQDTATSLGLSLSPHMQAQDLPIMTSMVDAIFDRGDYRNISLVAINGELLIERSNPVTSEHVPEWFINTISLQAPRTEALVMSGWRQAATVAVTSHSGRAYNELWSNSVDTLKLFLASAAVTLILGLLAVRIILRPLQRVEMQADAICNQSYPIQEKLPRTRELRSVVMAMNRLSQKVRTIFTDQAALTERLREQAYLDPVTGLGNRRYFNRQLQALLESREGPVEGAFLLIELRGLAQANEKRGYAGGDLLLQKTGKLVQTRIKNTDNGFTARIAGAGFGVVLTEPGIDEAELLADSLCHNLQQLHADGLVESDDICNIGIAMWKHGDTLTDLLSEADIALRAAQSAGPNSWKRNEPPAIEQTDIHGTAHWRDYLREIINTGNVSLVAQPVYSLGDASELLLHKEVLLRIPDTNGKDITAGIFMPMAEHAGLASEMDKLAITVLLEYMEANHDATDYAINLSSTSFNDPVFIEWLCKKLDGSPTSTKRLLMEFPEYGVLRNIQQARQTIEHLAGIGCRCGIDHFGRGFYSFGYLSNLKVSYLKVDSSYTRHIEQEDDNQFFIQALTDTAHSIDIKVIAQSIETAAERDIVKGLKLDGVQGYLTGKPQALRL
ncbi:MAG: EAL domain-containing protein [Gammaproteobacteria bacterium]|nr:EAL domain-containing protein [Gammaproteobacteria bacterium]